MPDQITARRAFRPMAVLTSLFFMWGFMTVMNDVLIPHLKSVFDLNYFQSMLVQFCFFGAYFIGSLLYFLVSRASGDPIARHGYKRGLIAGLFVSALGSFLFYPAAMLNVYWLYLTALFVLGLGFTLLQIAANPFVAIIGTPDGASSRLNLAQAFNSLGTMLSPLIGGYLIFKYFAGVDAVKFPYLAFGILLLLQALLVQLAHLPEPLVNKDERKEGSALDHPHLLLGMVAIFCYVGAEVAIGSLLINFVGLEHIAGLAPDRAKTYLSLYWGGAMCGRFLGAISLSDRINAQIKMGLMLGLAILLGGLLFVIMNIEGEMGWQQFLPMLVLIVGNVVVFRAAGDRSARNLGLFSIVVVLLLFTSMFTSGPLALWALTGIGLFNSIMWSNIFTLAIDGLGEVTSEGSSLLVMMIVGGALVPALQGLLADTLATSDDPDAGLQISFIVPALCYVYLAYYGMAGHQKGRTHPMVE